MKDDWMSISARDDKVLYKGPWLSIRQTPDGYEYMHQEKSNGGAVAVLAYRLRPTQIVGRFEECPPHRDGLALCALTGMMDHPGEHPATTAARELQEEAGIMVNPEELKALGTIRPSKASDTLMHLFSVNIGENRDIGKSIGDGTRGEENAYCKWVTVDEALRCKDPMVATLLARTFGIDAVRG